MYNFMAIICGSANLNNTALLDILNLLICFKNLDFAHGIMANPRTKSINLILMLEKRPLSKWSLVLLLFSFVK